VASKLRLDRAPAPVLIEGDARVQALQAVSTQPGTSEEYVDAISRLWSRAHAAFLDIGRLLIRAKETLPHGEYTTAVEGRLPFAARTAYQLREAARWALEMDRLQSITLDALPGSYSTIYLLSTLDPATLERAQKEGLVRPELRRSELIAWRRNVAGQGHQTLYERRQKLLRERARLDEELRRIEAELAK
jgi:hypothetical protein